MTREHQQRTGLQATHKTVLPNQTLKLDLDNDGATEFSLKIFNSHLNNGVYQTRQQGPSLAGGGGAIRSGAQSDFNLGLRGCVGFESQNGGADNFRTGIMAYCLVTNAGSQNYAGPWRNQKKEEGRRSACLLRAREAWRFGAGKKNPSPEQFSARTQ